MKEFFANHIYLDYMCRILASYICGFILGYERKKSNHAVGIRTLILINVSAALLSIVSIEMADCGMITGDPTRIAAGVITGIGFIGGGAILRQGFNIKGITTAAVIFAGAGIGMSFGAGIYIPTIFTFLVIIISLGVLEILEHKVFPAENTKMLHFTFESSDVKETELSQIIEKEGIKILDTDIDFIVSENKTIVNFMVKTPRKIDYIEFAKKFTALNGFCSFNMTRK